MADAKLRTILNVPERHGGSVSAAAAELNIYRETLYRKLRRHDLQWTREYR